MTYLFTSESVSEGHPDKVADQISDSILDDFLRQDREAKVACETFVSTGLVVVGGEVKSDDAYVDIQNITRNTIEKIGYNNADYMFDSKSCGILSAVHEQSPDINRGVVVKDPNEQGAGDQGIMFGYACKETTSYMPIALFLSHLTLQVLAKIRKIHEALENKSIDDIELLKSDDKIKKEKYIAAAKKMFYLRPDAKSQFTIEYSEDNVPLRVHTIVVSTQHDEFIANGNSSDNDINMQNQIFKDVKEILIPLVIDELTDKNKKLFEEDYILHVNPTGKFVIGGPHGDTGLTGRKIIVDTYGGRAAHGGGAFSGKDPSKVDRSAAYAARYIAKNMVAAGVADTITIQLSYAIGIAKPINIYVNTEGTSHVNMKDEKIAEIIDRIFDLRPAKIIERFQLKYPIYFPTAAYGHFGRTPYKKEVELLEKGKKVTKSIQFFGWELLDSVYMIKKEFSL